MQIRNQKAFTMVELVFVIVVIGILAAVALPRFGGAAEDAYLTKAQTTLTTVRVALKTERQRRILRGDFKKIGDLGDGTYAFSLMEADTDGNQADVLQYPMATCATGQKACWSRTDATHYSYIFPNAAMASSEGKAKFVLNDNATLVCDNDAADCALITK